MIPLETRQGYLVNSWLLNLFPDPEQEGTNEADKHRLLNTKATNPFAVMNKALAENLGRPMFEKNVAPRR